jgi:hypothetical protein
MRPDFNARFVEQGTERGMMKLLALVVVVAALFAIVVASALATGDPSGTGQPNQSCQAPGTTGPPGLLSTTNGFATKAVNVYAGTQPQNSTNPKSVSQYDVACFQVSSH